MEEWVYHFHPCLSTEPTKYIPGSAAQHWTVLPLGTFMEAVLQETVLLKWKRTKGRNVKEALILLPTHQGLPSTEEIQPKQISGLRKKRTRYTLQYKLIFMCFCQEGHKPERFQTVTQDRGVLKVNLWPSILQGSIVLSCCCDFMDVWNTSPQPIFWGGVIN